jgi:hypothetical protein
VLNPSLFDDLAAIGPEVAVRCAWSIGSVSTDSRPGRGRWYSPART